MASNVRNRKISRLENPDSVEETPKQMKKTFYQKIKNIGSLLIITLTVAVCVHYKGHHSPGASKHVGNNWCRGMNSKI